MGNNYGGHFFETASSLGWRRHHRSPNTQQKAAKANKNTNGWMQQQMPTPGNHLIDDTDARRKKVAFVYNPMILVLPVPVEKNRAALTTCASKHQNPAYNGSLGCCCRANIPPQSMRPERSQNYGVFGIHQCNENNTNYSMHQRIPKKEESKCRFEEHQFFKDSSRVNTVSPNCHEGQREGWGNGWSKSCSQPIGTKNHCSFNRSYNFQSEFMHQPSKIDERPPTAHFAALLQTPVENLSENTVWKKPMQYPIQNRDKFEGYSSTSTSTSSSVNNNTNNIKNNRLNATSKQQALFEDFHLRGWEDDRRSSQSSYNTNWMKAEKLDTGIWRDYSEHHNGWMF